MSGVSLTVLLSTTLSSNLIWDLSTNETTQSIYEEKNSTLNPFSISTEESISPSSTSPSNLLSIDETSTQSTQLIDSYDEDPGGEETTNRSDQSEQGLSENSSTQGETRITDPSPSEETDPVESSSSPTLPSSMSTRDPSLTRPPVTFKPPCTEILCPSYLTVGVVINMIIAIIRIFFCIFVLLLGIKMPADFMRTVTMAIYIPIGVRETFYFYEEIVLYVQQFQNSNQFAYGFINWTQDVQTSFDEYLHFDFMIMIIIGLHCCRICIRDDESIFVFPVKTIALVLQIIPLFLCLLDLVPGQQNSNVVLIIIGIISRLTTISCFSIITLQISYSIYLVTQELPYDHAASTDMQIRDARSRLVWFLIYLIIPYLSIIPFFLDAMIWIIKELNGSGNQVDQLGLPSSNSNQDFLVKCQIVLSLLKLLVSYYRTTWLIILTCFFLPPYRRAVPLLCCCLPCCPRITIEPLPRKPKEMSTMYRDAE